MTADPGAYDVPGRSLERRHEAILTAAGLPLAPPPRPTWLRRIDVADTRRECALAALTFARELRRGVEASGLRREAASVTFHEASTFAARTFAELRLGADAGLGSESGEAAWVGAFAYLRDRAVRARAMGVAA